MEKTKFGVAVPFVAAALALMGLASGYVIAGILVGYILLKEENVWLKKTAVKIFATMLAFTALTYLVSFWPDTVGLFKSLMNLCKVYMDTMVFDQVFSLLSRVVYWAKDVVMLILAYIALTQKEIKLPVVDTWVEKYFG